jgi:aryl-alcohol dehydrogenase-like predicted oxidoreductase
MFERIALGTVQFGLSYGVANTTGQIGIDECERIVNEASLFGINTLDTAIGYGNSERVLGKLSLDNSWKIISKLPKLPDAAFDDVFSWVMSEVAASIRRLGVGTLYGLLLHYPSQLLSPIGPMLYESLRQLKTMGYVKKIGISIYEPEELDQMLGNMQFDIVQAPLSILDRRIVDSGWALRLRAMGIELHTRSAFLQGLLLMEDGKRPEKFERWQSIWIEWRRWLSINHLTPLEACLQYVRSIDQVDRVVIGVDSVAQLREILSSVGCGQTGLPNWPKDIDAVLLNPSYWSEL